MNSEPIWRAGTRVAAIASIASSSVTSLKRSTPWMIGRYSQISSRLTGFFASGRMRPRTKNSISTGTRVTDSSAAPAMAKVLVKASGENSRPSWPSSANTGRKDTVMISSEKNSAGPTSLQASTIAAARCGWVAPSGRRSMCLCAFSIITIAASTIAPIAIAIPPRLMMFEPRPSERMAMKANRMPSGSVMMATSALRTCSRKITHTAATIRLSSSSVHLRLPIARSMSSERS